MQTVPRNCTVIFSQSCNSQWLSTMLARVRYKVLIKKGIFIFMHAMKACRGVELQLYSFLTYRFQAGE
jgi:hypothetical protein